MTDSPFRKLRERRVLPILAVYAAGAWVAVEIVAFLVSTYDLQAVLVDLAVLLAISGGVASAVLAWLHGRRGRQAVVLGEKIFLSGLVLITGIAVYWLLSRADPISEFSRLEGQRLILEFPISAQGNNELSMAWKPFTPADFTGEGFVIFAYDEFSLSLSDPTVSMIVSDHPIRFHTDEIEFGRLIVVLPRFPSGVRDLSAGQRKGLRIESGVLSLTVDTLVDVHVASHTDSVVIRLDLSDSRYPAD